MLQVSNLKKSYGERTLFSNVTFALDKGERVGLLGRNGHGKSTLLKIIIGEETSDEGVVTTPKGHRLAYLSQHIDFSHTDVLSEVSSVFKADEREEQLYLVKSCLIGLGLSEKLWSEDPAILSGGEQLRVKLAKILCLESDLLILDEPTNYLDILSIRWLTNFLQKYPGEILLVTHNRKFMDDIVDSCVLINKGNIRKIKGKTDKVYTEVALESEILHKQTKNLERKHKQMERFVEKFRAKAGTASLASSRQKMLDKQKAQMPDLSDNEQSNFALNFRFIDFPAKYMAQIDELSFGYNEDQLLFSKLKFGIERSDRIAIIGKNGTGKSTLLAILLDQLKASNGNVNWHEKCVFGHFAQTNRHSLNEKVDIISEIQAVNPGLGQTEIRGICGSVGFSGDDAKKQIQVLSGGEQSRVMLGKIIATPCNVLILDEPTHHLDMESIDILCEAIERFEGAVIMVAHDEAMIERLAKKLIIFDHGNAQLFLGGYRDFQAKGGFSEDESLTSKDKPKKTKNLKKLKAQIKKEYQVQIRPFRLQKKETEEQIGQLEQKQKEVELALIEASRAQDAEKLTEYSKESRLLEEKLEHLYGSWEKCAEQLEEIENSFTKKMDSLS